MLFDFWNYYSSLRLLCTVFIVEFIRDIKNGKEIEYKEGYLLFIHPMISL